MIQVLDLCHPFLGGFFVTGVMENRLEVCCALFPCSQWKGELKDGVPELTNSERTNLEHELSDVLIYLVRLSQLCHIDLPKAVLEKFEHNKNKYPADIVYGSSKKYTEYDLENQVPEKVAKVDSNGESIEAETQ